MDRKRFSASPLSIAVSEKDFRNWVEQQNSAEKVERNVSAPETSGTTRWPNMTSLTVEDLKSGGQEWIDFLGVKAGLFVSYGIPRSRSSVIARLDENLARYIVNYLQMILVITCFIIFERPVSVLGLIVIVAILDWFSQFSTYTRLDKQGTRYQILSALVTLLIWLVVFLSEAVVSISRALMIAGIVTLLHALFRVGNEEEKKRLKEYRNHRKRK